MERLSRRPNVTVKIGGLLMSQGTFDFGLSDLPPTSEHLASLWKPFIERSLGIFGAERCMVGSNFPVEKAGCSYGTFWNAIKRVLADFSDTEKRLVLATTAAKFYSL